MRWLRWPIFTLIIMLVPVWLLLLIPKINGFGPTTLKQELKQQYAYEQLSTVLHQTESKPESDEAEVTDQALVILRAALTPEYIETKTNTLIDDTALWLDKKSDAQPVLDLNDVKAQVLTAYPDAQLQINELQQGLAAAQQELKDNPMPVDGVEGFESDGSTSQIEIAKMLQEAGSLNNFIAGDFRLNLGAALQPLYDFYQYYQLALPILIVVIVILAALFVFTIQGWQARIKNAGWLLVTVAIVNGILSAIFSVVVLKIGLDVIVGMIPSQAEAAGSIGRAAIQALFANYVQLELIISVALLVVGILLIIGAVLIGKKAGPTSARSPKATQGPAPSEPQGETPARATTTETVKT